MNFTIYHNPNWGKSRKSLELLRENGIEPEIIQYLKTPLSIDELKSISNKLNLSPKDFVRKNDSKYKELKLGELDINDDEMLHVIAKNPRILERPIIVRGQEAIIGRPPENILKLF